MPETKGVVAVGSLTDRDLALLGEGFRRAYRLDENYDFHGLLAAIDAAERERSGIRVGLPYRE